MQGAAMRISDYQSFANSTLDVKVSGCVDVTEDMKNPETKSIAQLIYEEKQKEQTPAQHQ